MQGAPFGRQDTFANGAPGQSTLPTVAALSRLWGDVTARALWAPPNFLKYLALSARLRPTLVSAARVRLVAPEGKVNDCACCTESCCVGPRSTVLLRLRDIATLKDLGRMDLVTQTKPTFTDDELAARPALGRTVRSQAWRLFPTLKQSRFGACQALDENGKCSLYPHWPLSCARFPYALGANRREVFFSPRCRSYWVRPDRGEHIQSMALAAVASYNERVKDFVLLAYAAEQLDRLGLLGCLAAPAS